MIRKLQGSQAIRYAVCGALATVLVAGTGWGHLSEASARSAQSEYAKASKRLDRAVADAEAVVRRNPRNASARVALGNAYLAAGRFDSAATTLQDAVSLGDSSPATALRLALALIGVGQDRDAVTVLDQNRDGIPAGDFGLALALAGEAGRGADVLAEALRNGESSAKLRQNLAYAYALDGRWTDARVMAAQDVPADQLDARMGAWATMVRPEDYQQRVAGLLGAPIRADAGQPAELALGGEAVKPAAPQFAAAEPVAELPPVGETAAAPAVSDPSREFVVAEEPAVPFAAAPAPAFAPVAEAPAASRNFDAAFAAAPPALLRPVATASAAPIRSLRARPVITAAAFAKPLRNGSHAVQLGSFSTPDNAKRAVKIYQSRHPELKNFALTITPAVVRGKNFWRVSAAGFNQASAFGLCSTVRTRGGGCLAYSASRTLPGALPVGGQGGVLMARR